MTALILLITFTLPIPTGDDLSQMGAILSGEVGGMPAQAVHLVATQLRYDYYRLGMHGLDGRWYASPRASRAMTRVMRRVFLEDFQWPRCRLVGSRADAAYWREHGYVAPDAVSDYSWSVRGLEINAFGCSWGPVVVNRAECSGVECPR